jgi:hypothetical protein
MSSSFFLPLLLLGGQGNIGKMKGGVVKYPEVVKCEVLKAPGVVKLIQHQGVY